MLKKIKLGNLIKVSSGDGISVSRLLSYGKYPVFGGNGINGYYSDYNVSNDTLIIGRVGEKCGNVIATSTNSWITDNALIVKPQVIYDNRYLNYLLNYINLNNYANKNAQPVISGKIISDIDIVYEMDLNIQKDIATGLQNIDNLIDNLQLLINKKAKIKCGIMSHIISSVNMNGEELGKLTTMFSGGTPLTTNNEYYRHGKIKWLSISDITASGKYTANTSLKITDTGLENSTARLFKKGTLFFAMYASIGKMTIATDNMSCSQAILGFGCENITRDYLYHYLNYINDDLKAMGQTGTQSNLSKTIVEKIIIKVPKDKMLENKISLILNNIDEEIEVLKEKLSKYKNIKDGMMEDLLTGKVRLSYE